MVLLLVRATLEHEPSRGCSRREGWLPGGTHQRQQPLQHTRIKGQVANPGEARNKPRGDIYNQATSCGTAENQHLRKAASNLSARTGGFSMQILSYQVVVQWRTMQRDPRTLHRYT